jgi:hypothetical protein
MSVLKSRNRVLLQTSLNNTCDYLMIIGYDYLMSYVTSLNNTCG